MRRLVKSMQKRGHIKFALLVMLFLLLTVHSIGVSAQQDTIDKAYAWLRAEAQLMNYGDTIQNAFILLALQDATSKNYLLDKAYQGEVMCWSDQQATSANMCSVLPTAYAGFALSYIGFNTANIQNWLYSKLTIFKDIDWYFQFDIPRGLTANCTIYYKDGSTNVTINDDKTVDIAGFQGASCFSSADYWVKLSAECYENKFFKVVCYVSDPDEVYTVSLLYKKPNTDVWYLVNKQWQAVSGNAVDVEFIYSECLADSASCNYEATAVFSYMLKQEGNENYTRFMPYLTIAFEDNLAIMPHAWLYLITGDDSYGQQLLDLQSPQGFWLSYADGQFARGQYFHTALAAYSLMKNYNYDYNVSQTTAYLLERQDAQGYWKCVENGCDELRDTAFILFVFWPPQAQQVEGGGAEGETNVSMTECEINGGTCELTCDYDLYGTVQAVYDCDPGYVCCKPALEGYCVTDFNGTVCGIDETCTGLVVETFDEYECCLGACVIATQTCEEQGGELCDMEQGYYCESGYEMIASDATDTLVCCEQGYCSLKTCNELGGIICTSDELCSGTYTWASDTYGEKSCCIGECVLGETCSELGGEPCENAQCEGQLVTAQDTDKCCIGECLHYCEDVGGEVCEEGYVCKPGYEIDAIEQNCCEQGYCVKRRGFTGLIVVLILIILAVVLFVLNKKGLLKFKKTRKGEEKGKPGFGFGFKKPPTFPPAQQMQQQLSPRAPLQPLRPVPMPRPMQLPAQQMPKPAATTRHRPTVITRTPTTPSSVALTPTSLAQPKTTKAKATTKQKKKSKTEERLEKTLRKVKELTS